MSGTKSPHGVVQNNTEVLTKDRIASRSAVQMFEPMLAQFLSQVEIYYTDGETCFTDGKKIYISQKFASNHPRGGVFAIYHEMWHIAFGHIPIYKALLGNPWEHSLHNILTDAKINEQGRHRINFSEKEWEKYNGIIKVDNVCKILEGNLRKGWEAALQNIPITDTTRAFTALRPFVYKPIELPDGISVMEGEGALGQGFNADIQRETESRIAASIQAAKLRGTTGGSLESELEDIWLKPQVPWARIIAQAIMSRFKREKTWSRLNRKSYFIGGTGPITVMFKGRKKRPIMTAIIGIDVSGSISDGNIEEFLSEIKNLLSDFGAEVEVDFFDTKITDKFELKKLTDMKKITKASGRGGTSYQELFEHAEETKAKEVIVFTDGYGDADNIKVPPHNMRVWWICNTKDMVFPFGKVFYIASR